MGKHQAVTTRDIMVSDGSQPVTARDQRLGTSPFLPKQQVTTTASVTTSKPNLLNLLQKGLKSDEAAPETGPPKKMDPQRELECLHPYDSLLLSPNVTQKMLQDQIEKKKLAQQSSVVDHSNYGSHGGAMSLRLAGRFGTSKRNQDGLRASMRHLGPGALRSLNASEKKRSSVMSNHGTGHQFKDLAGDTVSQASSSAVSNVQRVRFGNREIETIKGTRIDKLSPMTRQMNIQAQVTLRQLEVKAAKRDLMSRL